MVKINKNEIVFSEKFVNFFVFFEKNLDNFIFYVIIFACLNSVNIIESCDSVHSELDILLENVKSGKPLSFDAIYALYLPLIDSMSTTCCKRYCICDAEFDDVRQEAMIALYHAALTYDAAKNVTFGAYAKVCIRNKILSYIRCFLENDIPVSLDERENDWDGPDFDTPEQLIISKESLCNLNRRIDETLTAFEKSVFALYIGDMSYADIAAALDKPEKSIDNAVHRIKAKLRKLI